MLKTSWFMRFTLISTVALMGLMPAAHAATAAVLDNSAQVYVALSNRKQFLGTGALWNGSFCPGKYICEVGDVNGDGKDDIIAFARTTNGSDDSDVYVSLSTGTSFNPAQKWQDYFCTIDEICNVADVNGDGKADIVTFVRTSGRGNDDDVYVALSDGTKFGAGQKWQDYFCTVDEICTVGDVNGDGKSDIITFVRTSGRGNDDDVYVALSDGTKFGAGQKWQDYFCTIDEICATGDVNGDGKSDIITFVRTSGRGNDDDVYVALSDSTKFGVGQKWQNYFCTLDEICAVGDVNGDDKADIVTFVRTSGRGNDDDVYVTLSDGTKFGAGQKWHDYFCTLKEICKLGDFDGDKDADALAFTRTGSGYVEGVKTIDVTVSMYTNITPNNRAPYEGIIQYFADAIYEMSNGAQRIGKATIFQNGQYEALADVVWVNRIWPSVPAGCISGKGRPTNITILRFCRVNFADIFDFPTPMIATQPSNWRGAGYTLGHEWGHFYYGLYDDYAGSAPCDGDKLPFINLPIYDLQTCDSMPNSVMQDQWEADKNNNLNWLNFGVEANQTRRNVNWRVYGASGWEVLARSPNLDPRDGQRTSADPRTYYPELAAVAPAAGTASSIQLPSVNARAALQIVWVNPNLSANQADQPALTSEYQPSVILPGGTSVLYPEAAIFKASLAKDGGLIAKAAVTGTVVAADNTSVVLQFKDDGVAPDTVADDGIYVASWRYGQNGLHQMTVNFSNAAGTAELTYEGNHYTPDPDGKEYVPPNVPVTDAFSQQAALEVMVNGYPEAGATPASTPLTTDNLDFPGRIDAAGAVNTFTFVADQAQAGDLIARVTDLDFGMQPRIKIYKGASGAALVGDYSFTPAGNKYFFTRLKVESGDSFTIEVSHVDPTAGTGSFSISVGAPLPNLTEQRPKVYLPVVINAAK